MQVNEAWHQWLTPIILFTWETDLRRIVVQGQPGKIISEILSPKLTRSK
jgi:hypothetical protein